MGFGVNFVFDTLNEIVQKIDSPYRNPVSVTDPNISKIIIIVINVMIGVTFALSIVGIAYSFLQFVLSRGDKKLVEKAKTGLTWSVAVFILTFLIVALKRVFFNLIGVSTDLNNEDFGF